MEALVSVIIPVYNVSPYLREALDSVVHQTYKNLEILVIDDGSTDESGTICDEYLSDPRVAVIHQENRGLSGARNTGLDRATGDYIAFLDPDDAYHPDMIMQLLQALLEYGADMSICRFVNIKPDMHMIKSEKKSRQNQKHLLTARDSLILFFEGSVPPAVWNKLYCHRLWEQLRFPEEYVYEDLHVMPFLLEKCNNIVVLPRALVYQRIRKESITHTDTNKNLQDYISALHVILAYAETVQPPLPSECIVKCQEKALRFLIFKHAALRRSKTFLNSPGFESILLEEIQNLSGNEPEFFLKKTKTVWWLYRHCPILLLPAQMCFRLVKSLLGKFKRGHL